MKTMKMIFASLTVVALLFAGFAFSSDNETKSTTNDKKVKVLAQERFGNVGGGNYVKIGATDPTGSCEEADDNPCVILAETEMTEFNIDDAGAPAWTPEPGSAQALY